VTHANDRRRWILLAALLAGAALIPLAAHAYLGSYGRYIADDFCTASTLRRFGFLESQAYWYQTWSGRYAYTFVVSLTQAAGPSLTPWLPSLALLAWMGAVLYAARQILGGRFPPLAGLALAALAVFTTLQGSPSVYQSLTGRPAW
jgi:hypothetical protein